MTRLSLASAILITLVNVRAAPAAAAEPEPYVKIFLEGRALLEKNNFTEALDKFQQSAAIKRGSGTLLNIGDCYEHLGRYNSAVLAFEEARSLAAEEKKPEREKEAADRAVKLSGMVSSITVKAGDATKVTVDGGDVEPDKPTHVDGGQHVVHIEMKCKRPKDLPVTVGNKADTQVVTVDPASLDPDPACAPKVEPKGMSTERLLSYVAGGAGVLGLGLGVGFGISAASKSGSLTDMCPTYPVRCNLAQKSAIDAQYDSAHSAATVSTIGFVVGLLLVGGAVALYIYSPEWQESHAKTGWVPGRFAF
jgi:hypothetical protein